MNIMVNGGCLKSRGLLGTVGTDGKAETGMLYEATQGFEAEGEGSSQPECSRRRFKDLRHLAGTELCHCNSCLPGACMRM